MLVAVDPINVDSRFSMKITLRLSIARPISLLHIVYPVCVAVHAAPTESPFAGLVLKFGLQQQ